jgi:predicted DNA repair protein MutK
MSGLLALLDDVAAIAKVAAASIDDVATQAVKAGAKTAGVLIDDAAVTPKYITGFSADRELPIIGRIALGSIRNKLFFLLPAAMLLSSFAPWLVTPLLMLGGCYLCFEGAEKVFHWLFPHGDTHVAADLDVKDPVKLEQERVAGAIKTDFILSAEIITIALAAIPASNLAMEAATLALVGVGITVAVYGSVALIVKADDIGLGMASRGRLGLTRAVGRGLVQGMPGFLRLLTIVGTAAMVWVGGSIVIHGLDVLGWPVLYDAIHKVAVAAGHALPQVEGMVEWLVTASLDGVAGLALGVVLIPVATRVIQPVLAWFSGRKTQAQ